MSERKTLFRGYGLRFPGGEIVAIPKKKDFGQTQISFDMLHLVSFFF